MAKKNFSGGIDALIRDVAQPEHSTPVRQPKAKTTVTANFVMDSDLHRRLKLVAVAKGETLKDVLAEAITRYLESEENK